MDHNSKPATTSANRTDDTPVDAKTGNVSRPIEVRDKQCSNCEKIKPIVCFGIKRKLLLGPARWESQCKDCDSKLRKKKYAKKKQLALGNRRFKRVIDFDSLQIGEVTASKFASPIGLNDLLRNLIFEVICSAP